MESANQDDREKEHDEQNVPDQAKEIIEQATETVKEPK